MKNVSCTVAAQSVSNTIMVLTLQICRFLLKQQKKSGDFLFEELFRSYVRKKRSLPAPLPYLFIKLVLLIKKLSCSTIRLISL